jgi:hypothetical protein
MRKFEKHTLVGYFYGCILPETRIKAEAKEDWVPMGGFAQPITANHGCIKGIFQFLFCERYPLL